MLDISSIYRDICHLNLKVYNSPFPTLFISAQDPDEACHLAISQLLKIILDQDPSIMMRIVCRRIKKYAKIDKIYILS
jgi:hypothetical protein